MVWVIAKRWEVGRQIGDGGQGRVFLAWDRLQRRWVAVKTYESVAEGEDVARQRFRQEAERAQALGAACQYVIEVLGYGENDGRGHPYLVTELAERGSIEQRRRALRSQGLELPRRLIHRILGQLGEALDAARRLHLTHRDIKLANLLLDGDDNLLLADFGSAQHELDPTMTQGVMGTAAYLAPERWLNQRATHAADVYAAAVVAYILLCHRPPFEGSMNEIMLAALHTEAPAPSSLRFGVPRQVDAILLRGVAKQPHDRWPTAKEMLDRLQAALADWATSDTETQPVVRSTSDETEVLSARERVMGANPQTRTLLAPTHVAREMADRVAGDDGRSEVILLSGGIVAIMLSLLFVVVFARLWAAMLGPVGTVTDLVAAAIGAGWRQAQAFSRGRSASDWLWLSPALVVVAAVATRKRRLKLGLAAVAITATLAVVFVLGSPRSNSDATNSTRVPTKSEMRHDRRSLLTALRREAARWEAHYRRHPNATARRNTRSYFAWAKRLVALAPRTPYGVRRLQLAHTWLVRWHGQRRAMMRSGAW